MRKFAPFRTFKFKRQCQNFVPIMIKRNKRKSKWHWCNRDQTQLTVNKKWWAGLQNKLTLWIETTTILTKNVQSNFTMKPPFSLICNLFKAGQQAFSRHDSAIKWTTLRANASHFHTAMIRRPLCKVLCESYLSAGRTAAVHTLSSLQDLKISSKQEVSTNISLGLLSIRLLVACMMPSLRSSSNSQTVLFLPSSAKTVNNS